MEPAVQSGGGDKPIGRRQQIDCGGHRGLIDGKRLVVFVIFHRWESGKWKLNQPADKNLALTPAPSPRAPGERENCSQLVCEIRERDSFHHFTKRSGTTMRSPGW